MALCLTKQVIDGTMLKNRLLMALYLIKQAINALYLTKQAIDGTIFNKTGY